MDKCSTNSQHSPQPSHATKSLTFAELTWTIAQLKRQRARLRLKRCRVLRLDKPYVESKSHLDETVEKDSKSIFNASINAVMPERLLFSAYVVCPSCQGDRLPWLQSRSKLYNSPSRRESCASQPLHALPETLTCLSPNGAHSLNTPVTHLSLGEWHVDTQTLKHMLRLLGESVTDIDFAPTMRIGIRTRLTPWSSCRCSAQNCDVHEDCRYSACNSLFGAAITDADLFALSSDLQNGQLRSLNLAHCLQATSFGIDALLVAFGRSLRNLDLSGCHNLDTKVANMLAAEARPNLQSLLLNAWTWLEDDQLSAISQACCRLHVLELCGCVRLTDNGVSSVLNTNSQLIDLRLCGCHRLTGECFTDVRGACLMGQNRDREQVSLVHVRPTLRKLDLGNCGSLRKSALRWMAIGFPRLTDLRVAGCPITDEGLRALAMAPDLRLRTLDVSGCSTLCADGGQAFEILARQQGNSLECLNVSRISRIPPLAVAALFSCEALKSFRLDAVPGADDDAFGGPVAVAAARDAAEALILKIQSEVSLECPGVSKTARKRSSRTAVHDYLRQQTNEGHCRLEFLTLAQCPKIGAGTVSWLAARLPNLVVLDLNGAGAGGVLTDASLCSLAHYCRSLQDLAAARPAPSHGMTHVAVSNGYLTDTALRAIGKNLRQLQRLDLRYHAYVSGSGLVKLPRAWPFLRTLKIDGWNALDTGGFRAILAAAPNLAYLSASACGLLDFKDLQRAAAKRLYVSLSECGESGWCLRPIRGAAAIEKRDAVFARFWIEDRAATAIACAYRWYRTERKFKRRCAARIVARAVRDYRRRRLDGFRLRFKLLVAYRRIATRYSAVRLQRFYRRRNDGRRNRAAKIIQSFYRASKALWMLLAVDLMHGSATIIEAAWRGRQARIRCPIAHLRLAEQHRREIGEFKPALAAVSDIQARHAVHTIVQYIVGLRAAIARHKDKRNGGYSHDKIGASNLQRSPDFRLPMASKRHLPVYGDMPARSFNSDANLKGHVHVFHRGNCSTVLWPTPATKRHREAVSDFDPTLDSYSSKVAEFERVANHNALATSASLSKIPWRDARGQNQDSLLNCLTPARVAQAKRTMLVHGATAAAEQKQVEEAMRLEKVALDEAEAAEKRELAAAAESESCHAAARRICALARGRTTRVAIRQQRIIDEIDRLSRRATTQSAAATAIQRRQRGNSTRVYMAAHGIHAKNALSTLMGASTGSDERSLARHRVESTNGDDDPTHHGLSAVDPDGAQSAKPRDESGQKDVVSLLKLARRVVARRVDVEFRLRRSYEREASIYERHTLMGKCDQAFEGGLANCHARLAPLDLAQLRLSDAAEANKVVTQALYNELNILGVSVGNERAKPDDKGRGASQIDDHDESGAEHAEAGIRGDRARGDATVPNGDKTKREERVGDDRRCVLDLALKGAAVRRVHLHYALEVVEMCQWWAVEALRCHYRRHRASNLLNRDASEQLAWAATEAGRVWKLREFIKSRREQVPQNVANRYFIAWLYNQQARLIDQSIALDAEQEHILSRDCSQLKFLLQTSDTTSRLTDELIDSLSLDARYDAEKVGLEIRRLVEDPESEAALRSLQSATVIKQRQEQLHKGAHLRLRARLEDLLASETRQLERHVAFQGDEQGLPRDKLPSITAVERNRRPDKAQFDQDRWYNVYRCQPWLAQQDIEENRRREQRDVKRLREANMAAAIEQRRRDLERETTEIEELDNLLSTADKTIADPNASREDKTEAQAIINTKREKLARLQEDHERREKSLEQLAEQLAQLQFELELEDSEANERLAAVMAAKAEFERRECIDEEKQAALNQKRLEEIQRELNVIASAEKNRAAAPEGGGSDDEFDVEELAKRRSELESEMAQNKRELEKISKRKRMREALNDAAEAEARADEEAKRKKELQAKLREEKKQEAALRTKQKLAEQEAKLAAKMEKKRYEAEAEAERRAKDVLSNIGLEDPTLRKTRPVTTKFREAFRKRFAGYESAAVQEHESTSMYTSLHRRQKMKIGTLTALRAIRFTVGTEETAEFSEQQSTLASRTLPHYIRLQKTIGVKEQIVVWVEETADQDQFVTDLELAATNVEHQLYCDKRHRGWERYMHDKLKNTTPEDPGFAVWVRRRADAVYAIVALDIAYTAKDEEVLADDGYSKVEPSLENFGVNFGVISFWIKKVNRNAIPKFENQETLAKELKQVRRELNIRPNDQVAQAREKRLLDRIDKLREDTQYRDQFREDPLKYAVEFLALTQSELERWMRFFEDIDTGHTGLVKSDEILTYVGLRTDCTFLQRIFTTLAMPDDQGWLDFGETIKCVGSFCFFQERELLHYAYKIFDADDSGSITHDEFVLLLSDLHAENDRGRTMRALKEITLIDGGKLTFDNFVDIHRRFPNILHPVFQFQHKMRQVFFGVSFWEKKLRKYMSVKADIREMRALNTDKIMAEEVAVANRRQRREKLIEIKKVAAQNSKSMIRRTLLSAQIASLAFAARRDK